MIENKDYRKYNQKFIHHDKKIHLNRIQKTNYFRIK